MPNGGKELTVKLPPDDDVWFEIPELSARAQEVVTDASVKATYSAGPTMREQAGVPAEVWVGICNSAMNDGRLETMEAAGALVAESCLEWLRESDLVIDGTLVNITFGDASEMGPFSSFNALETIRFRVTSEGSLTPVRSELSPEDEASFRDFRYRLSGRRVRE